MSVLGALWMLRRRTYGPLLLLAGDAVAALFLLSRTSPYAAAKVMMLFSIAAVLTAMLGAVALHDAGRRIEGWILAVVIGGGVLWTNALAFHDSSVAPQARFKELASIGSRFSGQGPAFYNLWDTYPIYFLRQESTSIPDVNAGPVPLRTGLPAHDFGQASSAWDPNDLDPAWLQTNRLLILGRSPIIARPPANYQLAYRGHLLRRVAPRRLARRARAHPADERAGRSPAASRLSDHSGRRRTCEARPCPAGVRGACSDADRGADRRDPSGDLGADGKERSARLPGDGPALGQP